MPEKEILAELDPRVSERHIVSVAEQQMVADVSTYPESDIFTEDSPRGAPAAITPQMFR
jgi:hypothetical protein